MTFPDLFSWTVNFNWAWQGAASRLFWRICHLLWVEYTAKIQSVYLKLLLTNESKKKKKCLNDNLYVKKIQVGTLNVHMCLKICCSSQSDNNRILSICLSCKWSKTHFASYYRAGPWSQVACFWWRHARSRNGAIFSKLWIAYNYPSIPHPPLSFVLDSSEWWWLRTWSE